MPGNVNTISAAGLPVMPLSLSRAFSSTRTLAAMVNDDYADGSSQRKVIVTNGGDPSVSPRMAWNMTKRLTTAQIIALRDFYDARSGEGEAFLFYDPHESDPFGNFDDSGEDSDGRFIVRFVGQWRQDGGLGRHDVQNLQLIEIS